jgi:hypothetical protein
MTNTLTKIAALLAITSAAACGPSAETANPQSFTRGPNNPSFDVATGVLTANGTEIGRSGDEVIESNGRARVTRNAAQNSRVAQAGSGTAYALAYGTYNGTALSGAVYGRSDTPTLPSGGTANFTGDYAGVVTGNTGAANQRISSLTLGDARLAVDFNNSTINGSISNRQVRSANGGAFGSTTAATTINLGSTSISDSGRFAGTTVAGQFTQSGDSYTATGGSYAGVLAGADGTEGVGAVSLTHTSRNSGNRFTEQGVFAVSR